MHFLKCGTKIMIFHSIFHEVLEASIYVNIALTRGSTNDFLTTNCARAIGSGEKLLWPQN